MYKVAYDFKEKLISSLINISDYTEIMAEDKPTYDDYTYITCTNDHTIVNVASEALNDTRSSHSFTIARRTHSCINTVSPVRFTTR